MTFKNQIGQVLIPMLPISRFAFDILRLEFTCWKVRMANRILPSRLLKLHQLKKRRRLLANIACGPFTIPGFENLDLVAHSDDVRPWDCTRSLPFNTESCKGIRAEHFLEHLEFREQVPRFFTDCFRCLEPGGVLRIIVPDAERFMKAYSSGDTKGFQDLGSYPFPEDLPTGMDVISHVFHQGHEHRWAYDFENLKLTLEKVGFQRIERMEFGESLDPELGQDREQHRPYSLYVEAVKAP